MAIYEAVVDSEGQLTLPRELVESLGGKPGQKLELADAHTSDPASISAIVVSSGAKVVLRNVRIIGVEAAVSVARRDRHPELEELKAIAGKARRAGARPSTSGDPVGDYLLAEDARTRSDQP